MITAITTFPPPKAHHPDEARTILPGTAPKYQGVPGLVRKVYVLSPGWQHGRGIYLWNTRADADCLVHRELEGFVREKYGTDPPIVYFDSPVLVDNVTHSIVSDA
jgi:hypothetical protein